MSNLALHTHYEVVLGFSGQEFGRNYDFSIEQNLSIQVVKYYKISIVVLSHSV